MQASATVLRGMVMGTATFGQPSASSIRSTPGAESDRGGGSCPVLLFARARGLMKCSGRFGSGLPSEESDSRLASSGVCSRGGATASAADAKLLTGMHRSPLLLLGGRHLRSGAQAGRMLAILLSMASSFCGRCQSPYKVMFYFNARRMRVGRVQKKIPASLDSSNDWFRQG
jgi:hypothetical protein